MNDERRAGERLSRLALGLGARSLPSSRDVFLIEGHTDASAKKPVGKIKAYGLGGCSCTKRKKAK